MIWVYRTSDGQPHWASTRWIAFNLGNYQITEVRTEQDAARMLDVFTMTTDEWCSMRVRAGLPMYPPKQSQERDTRYADTVDRYLVRSIEAVTP